MPPADPRTDQELVEAGNRGDETALAALYLRHREWAAALALRFTGNRDEALDVMQEAFVYLFGKFPGLVLRARVTTLLYPAVKNIALARKRKRRGVGGEAGEELIAQHGCLEDSSAVAPGEASGDLAAAVAGLPDGQREGLLMRVGDGMGVAEIAAALSIPEGTVKSRLHHALAALRDDPRTRKHFLPD